MRDDRAYWNERYREAGFELPGEAAPLLRRCADWLPGGRALDVATGTGRNALFLAERDYEVDAVDVADEALATARARAFDRDVKVNWIQVDLEGHPLPEATYDVIVVTFFHALDRLPDLKDALAPGASSCTSTTSAPTRRPSGGRATTATGSGRTTCSGRVST